MQRENGRRLGEKLLSGGGGGGGGEEEEEEEDDDDDDEDEEEDKNETRIKPDEVRHNEFVKRTEKMYRF